MAERHKRPKPKQDPKTLQKKRRRSRQEILKKEQWYKMISFFQDPAQGVMRVQNEDIVLSGWVPPDMDCAICLTPPSITHDQGLALQKILEANFRKPVLLLTNNTQLVRLKPISDGEAEKIMKGELDGSIVQVSREKEALFTSIRNVRGFFSNHLLCPKHNISWNKRGGAYAKKVLIIRFLK